MANIKELPVYERPREKALRYGISSLSDIELLSLLLDKGYRGSNILEISTSLLSKYGGLVGLLNIPISELKKNKGIKNVGSLKIALIGEFYKRVSEKKNYIPNTKIDSEYLYNKYKDQFIYSSQEQLILIILNRNKHIIYETTLYKGSRDTINYSFADIYKEIAKFDGRSFYLIHNHPSGDCLPSKEDILSTLEIKQESKRAHISLIDHIIIGEDCYYSFRKNEKITISYWTMLITYVIFTNVVASLATTA